MTIINTTPDRPIQLGYEGEDKVTVLRFRYGADWLENGTGIFRIRIRRHGETQAYNAQLVADDAENNCLLMTVTNTELSVKGAGEMQVVYSGENFVKKSPIYSYNVSRAVDEAVDPPAQDVYTQIIESLSDLQTDVRQIDADVADLSELTTEKIGDLSALTTETKTDLVSAINEVNEHGGSTVTVDDALSTTSTNPVQNRVVTNAIQGKADIQTVSALADAVNDLDSDVQGLQTAIQGKADASDVTALETAMQSKADADDLTAVQTALASKADASTVTTLSDTVSGLQTTVQGKADSSTVDSVQDELTLLERAADQYMSATSAAIALKADKTYVDTQLAGKADTQDVTDVAGDVSALQTALATKAGTSTATTSADGLMSAQDKARLDALYEDYSSALTALGGE